MNTEVTSANLPESTESPYTNNYCRDCKHLLGNRNNIQDAHEKWACFHPSNILSRYNDWVTGETKTTLTVANILTTKNNACEGKWFEEYKKPNYSSPVIEQTNPIPATSSKIKIRKSGYDLENL